MKTIENNKLIAEFMDYEGQHEEWCGNNIVMTNEYLQNEMYPYNPHGDWNHLMEVVEKIQSIESGRFGFTIDPWSMEIIDYKENEARIVYMEFIAVEDPLMHRYYEMALEFIEWYNQQPK